MPLLVVVTGPPGSGKTTLARPLVRAGAHEALDVPGAVIRVETTEPVDVGAVAARVLSAATPG